MISKLAMGVRFPHVLGLKPLLATETTSREHLKNKLCDRLGGANSSFYCTVDFMKTLYVALLLATASLGGCCLSSSGCNMSPIATARPDLDGLGQPPAEDLPSPTPKQRVSSRAKDHGEEPTPVYSNSNNGDDLEDEDARLKRKLVICRGCAMPGN